MTWRFSALPLAALCVCVATSSCSANEPSEASDEPVTESPDGGASASLPPPSTASSSSSSSSSSGGSSSGGASSSGDGGTTPTSTTCKVSFAKDILSMIDQAGCAALTCHGTRFGKDPRLAPDDGEITYNALLAYQIAGKNYIKPGSKNPEDSAMHCHLAGQCGAKMPPTGGSISPSFIAAADTSLACGSPKN